MKAVMYISYAADFLAVVLMICQMIRTGKLQGERESVKRYFRIFSLMVLVISVLHLLKSYADMELGVYSMRIFRV